MLCYIRLHMIKLGLYALSSYLLSLFIFPSNCPPFFYSLLLRNCLVFSYSSPSFFSFSQSKLSKFAAVRVLEDRAIVTLISNLERGSEVMATAFKVMERLGWVTHHTHHTILLLILLIALFLLSFLLCFSLMLYCFDLIWLIDWLIVAVVDAQSFGTYSYTNTEHTTRCIHLLCCLCAHISELNYRIILLHSRISAYLSIFVSITSQFTYLFLSSLFWMFSFFSFLFLLFNCNRITPEMFSQGASKVNISFVVQMKDREHLIKTLHACYFEGLKWEDIAPMPRQAPFQG